MSMWTQIFYIAIASKLGPLRKSLKLGTGVVQKSYGRKFKVKWAKRKATQIPEEFSNHAAP